MVQQADSRLTLTVPEAAKLLGVSRNSAYRAVETGELPVLRFRGRLLVPKVALEAMLQKAARL